MLLAEDVLTDPEEPLQITIVNLRATYWILEDSPALIEEICCVIAVTDGRGKGRIQIICVEEETDITVFTGQIHEVRCSADPLDLMIIPFRLRDCRFPRPGMYSFQLLWNGESISSCPLRMR
jgi:hypothetical protein